MAYRLLLPSSEPLFPKQVEAALDQFDVFRTSDVTPTWSLSDLAVEASDAQGHRLTLRLLRDDIVEQEADERHLLRPDGVRIWLELRTPTAADDRSSRLTTRLCAMTIASRLQLPVMETRNGVFCRSPEAFTAWCSRVAHPDIVLLGETEHITLPKRRRTLAAGPSQADADPAAAQAHLAPLPTIGFLERLWRQWRGLRTYVITVPGAADTRVLAALVEEITDTFGDSNVLYEEKHHRLLIVAKDSPGTQDVIGYFRRRAHPERLRLAAAMR